MLMYNLYLQAMVDVCAEQGWLATTLRLQLLMQMVSQARWLKDSPLTTLPHIEPPLLHLFQQQKELSSLPSLLTISHDQLANTLSEDLDGVQVQQVEY